MKYLGVLCAGRVAPVEIPVPEAALLVRHCARQSQLLGHGVAPGGKPRRLNHQRCPAYRAGPQGMGMRIIRFIFARIRIHEIKIWNWFRIFPNLQIKVICVLIVTKTNYLT